MSRIFSTRVLIGSALAQVRLTRNKVEDLGPVLTMPLIALVSVAVLVHGGKPELASYGILALGAVAALIGYGVLQRMLERMRRGGTLGLM